MSYPRWLKSKRYGHVIKFTGRNTGVVVKEPKTKINGRSPYDIGYTSNNWDDCTMTAIWDTVLPPSNRVRLHNMVKSLSKEST